MRQTILAVAGLLIVSVVIIAGWRSRAVRRHTILSRPTWDLEAVYQAEFHQMSRDDFLRIWKDLAGLLELEAEKMSPNDSIQSIAPVHLPELYVDHGEYSLKDKGIREGEVNLDTPIRDIVRLLAREGSTAGSRVRADQESLRAG